MPNILVSTFGTTWAIGAELIAISAYPFLDILEENDSLKTYHSKLKKQGVEKIDEIWLICTLGELTNKAIALLEEWLNYFDKSQLPKVRFLSLEGLEDLTNDAECQQMSDFIYRVVLKANEYKKDGKLILSLTGGRKTMSTDMQFAADLFGCDSLIHLADNGLYMNKTEEFKSKLAHETANKLFIVEVLNNKSKNYITEIPSKINSDEYPIEFSRDNRKSVGLYNEIYNRLQTSESLHYNAYLSRTDKNLLSIFQGLQQLHPLKHEQLEKEKPSFEWVSRLPKAELHFHFGGILDIEGLIGTAKANKKEINYWLDTDSDFAEWLKNIKNKINNRSDKLLIPYVREKEKLRKDLFKHIPKPIVVAAFIASFKDCPEYLDHLIFGEFLKDENSFSNIGIKRYETLGDLQGSALLQSEASIKKACHYLLEYCRSQNLKYLELRCSPVNYTRGGLSEMDVVRIMHNELYNQHICKIRLIIIGSRHGDMAIFDRHVSLAIKLVNTEKYQDFIVGFDIAGNEGAAKPAALRSKLIPLLEACVHMTIHAGEDQPVKNIWEAAYELNADRIGHGLTLIDDENLMNRFRDRNIFIELCPSSNFQIRDYSNSNLIYPLRFYLEKGLKITLNTDNPGMSRTTISHEFYKMVEYADLTKMELLVLIRNSFQGSFLPKNEKKVLIVEVENEIYKLLTEED